MGISELLKEFDKEFKIDDGILTRWEQVLPDGDWEGWELTSLEEIKSFIKKAYREGKNSVRELLPKETKTRKLNPAAKSYRNQILKKLKQLSKEEGLGIHEHNCPHCLRKDCECMCKKCRSVSKEGNKC